ncbi:MAG TPA: hypothetical protein VFZ90_10360, partial [Gemmatimonadales bacterium]
MKLLLARIPAEAENVGALDEEGPLLRVEGLECAEIHHRRVNLYLAEVRIQRGTESQIAGEAVFEVEAGRAVVIVPAPKRVARYRRLIGCAGEQIRRQLHPPLRPQLPQVHQMGVAA